MEMLTLNENELLDINGGKGKGSDIDIRKTYDDIKYVYHELRDHGYDAAKDFVSGFAEGITSIEFH